MTTERYASDRDRTAQLAVGGPGHTSGARCDTPRCTRTRLPGNAGLRRVMRYCGPCCEAIDAAREARKAAA